MLTDALLHGNLPQVRLTLILKKWGNGELGGGPLRLVQRDRIIADYLGLKADHEDLRKGMVLATLYDR